MTGPTPPFLPGPDVKLDKDNNPGDARWCHYHHRLECTHLRRRPAEGETERQVCHAPAIRGLDSCRKHAGMKKVVAVAKGEAMVTAWSAIGDVSQVDHKIAVLGVLQMTWFRLGIYAELLRQQVAAEGDTAGSVDSDQPKASGLIGYKYGAAGKDGVIYAQSEEVRALVVLEAQERERVVRFAEVAHKMGISDRLTSIAEKWSDVVIARIMSMLSELDLSPEQEREVPRLIQAHLGSIELGMGEPDKKAA